MAFPTSIDLYNRIKYDPMVNSHNVTITYHDAKFDKYIDIDFHKWLPINLGGDIPYHRIYYFKYKNTIIWDRNAKVYDLEPIMKTNRKLLPDVFTVMTFNVLNDVHMEKAWVTRHGKRQNDLIEFLKMYITSENTIVDIICLQEVSKDFLVILKESFADFIVHSSVTDNVVIITKAEILDQTIIKFNQHKEAIVVKLELSDGNYVNVINLHLTSDHQPNASLKRREQISQLLTNINPLEHTIIVGDFNTSGNVPLLDNFMDAREYLQQEGYTFDPLTNECAKISSLTQTQETLDRFLCSKFIEPKTYGIMQTIKLSDHYPVVASFKLLVASEPGPIIVKQSGMSMSLTIMMPPDAPDYDKMYRLRKKYADNHDKWAPHINVHMGFIAENGFVTKFRTLMSTISNMQLIFNRVGFFDHGQSYTLYVGPDEQSHRQLTALFSLLKSNMTIHMTIGKFTDRDKMMAVMATLDHFSLQFTIDHVSVLVKTMNDKFHKVTNIIPFGVIQTVTTAELTGIIEQIIGTQFECKCYVGGSGVFNNVVSDLDLVVIGFEEKMQAIDKITRFFQLNGSFVGTRTVHNQHITIIRTKYYDGTCVDIHYYQNNQNKILDISKIKLSECTKQELTTLSTYFESRYISDTVEKFDVFVDSLKIVKGLAKKAHVYGQECGYLGGLSWAIMVAYYLARHGNVFVREQFAKYYAEYNYNDVITLKQYNGNGKGNGDRHREWMKIYSHICVQNTARNLTRSTFATLKHFFETNMEPAHYKYRVMFTFKSYDNNNNNNTVDELTSWLNSKIIAMILTLEKILSADFDSCIIKNETDDYTELVWGLNTQDDPTKYTKTFEDICSKVRNLFPNTDIFFTSSNV